LYGSDAVARFFVGVSRKGDNPTLELSVAEVNGWPAIVARRGSATATTLSIETDGSRIFSVHVVSNPDKLLRV
ncbi:MAG: RNA polymerase sigma-70 factor, partial [Gemmatimonadales bacterium]